MKQIGFFVILFFGVMPVALAASGPFPDISIEHKNVEAIQFLKEQGIVSGDGRTGLFLPDRILNRAEFARMIVTSQNFHSSISYSPIFPDVPNNQWYTPYLLTTHQMGILLGNVKGRAEPGKQVLMAEALAMGLRAFGYPIPPPSRNEPWHAPYLRIAQEKQLLSKINAQTNQGLPRAQAAQLLFNIIQAQASFQGEIFDTLVCIMKPLAIPSLLPVMNEVNLFYDENSYGKIRFRTRFAGNTVFQGSAPTDFSQEINAALSVCDPAVDFSTVDRMIIYPSKTTDLSFSVKQDVETEEGIRNIGILFLKDFLTGHIAHELGHTFRATHAHGLECGTAVVKRDGCRTAAYGTPYDVLGEPTFTSHFHGWNKAKWLNWTASREVTESGTYTLPAIEVSASEPHVLRIPYGENPDGGLCVEYRKPIGFDNFTARGIRDRIAPLIRFPQEGALLLTVCPDVGTIHLMDTTPNSQTGEDLADFADAYLTHDRTFENDLLKITISFEPMENNKASVTIEKREGGFIPVLPGF